MKVRLLATDGQGSFNEIEWDKPEPSSTEIEVKAVLTGVCRSDIAMMEGKFGPLPINMHGHEGLGQITRVGANIMGVKIGDFVATRGEPAYADYYNVRDGEFVRVPDASPKYILEPVACGINVIQQDLNAITTRSGPNRRLAILGTGFLAWVAYHTLKLNHVDFEIDIIGNHNHTQWERYTKVLPAPVGTYDVVVDLTSNSTVFDNDIINANGLLVLAAEKDPKVSTSFANLLWKAVTIICPSPRHHNFIRCMKDAEYWITNESLFVDSYWTRAYNRDTEWQQAFKDGVDRPAGYSRGYLKW